MVTCTPISYRFVKRVAFNTIGTIVHLLYMRVLHFTRIIFFSSRYYGLTTIQRWREEIKSWFSWLVPERKERNAKKLMDRIKAIYVTIQSNITNILCTGMRFSCVYRHFMFIRYFYYRSRTITLVLVQLYLESYECYFATFRNILLQVLDFNKFLFGISIFSILYSILIKRNSYIVILYRPTQCASIVILSRNFIIGLLLFGPVTFVSLKLIIANWNIKYMHIDT